MKTTCLILTIVVAATLPLLAADTKPASPPGASAAATKPAAEAAKPKTLPFNGKIAAVDRAAQTITLSGKSQRVVKVTAQTKIVRDGKPATLADAKVGEPVGGSARKTEGGQLEAVSLRLGPKAAAEKPEKPPKAKTKETVK